MTLAEKPQDVGVDDPLPDGPSGERWKFGFYRRVIFS